MINKIASYYLNNLKRKVSLETVIEKLEIIVFVLKSGVAWKDLELLNLKYCESNYRKFYYKLVKLNIIDEMLKKINKNSNVCFIDTTNIRNKHGKKESIGFCPQDKKHKGNKVSLTVSENRKVLNCCVDKGSCHDTKMFYRTIENVKCKKIIGDKGYTSKEIKETVKEKGIELIYPYKRNSKLENNKEENELLKKRHIVENVICNVKKFKRIDTRYERNIDYFINFVKLACLLI